MTISIDQRTIATPVYEKLAGLRKDYPKAQNETRLKEQKSQAVELYTYLATWGLMRLKAEEKALSQDGKKDVVKVYFQCLEKLSHRKNIAGDSGLETIKQLSAEEYLGLTGLGLTVAQEFSFWTTALYHDVKGEG